MGRRACRGEDVPGDDESLRQTPGLKFVDLLKVTI